MVTLETPVAQGQVLVVEDDGMGSLETPAAQGQVLVVEDDGKVREMMITMVRKLGYTPLEAPTVARALSILKRQTVDLLLLDIYLKGTNGLDILHTLRRQESLVPTVVVSGHISNTVARQLIELGVHNMVSKPFTFNRLTTEIQSALCLEGGNETSLPADSVGSEQEDRRDQRIPMKLPIRTSESKNKRDYMKLVDISSTGMQTLCKNLDVVKLGNETQNHAFDIPIVARLAWIKAKPNDTFSIGWEFDKRIQPHMPKEGTIPILRDSEKRTDSRIRMQRPIKARIGKHKHLDMQLIDISSIGMQTLCKNLDVLILGSPEKRFTFEFSVIARLAWVNANSNDTFTVGWEFADPRRS